MEAIQKRLDLLERQQRDFDKTSQLLFTRVSTLEERLDSLTGGPQQLASKRTLAINNASKQVNAQEDEPWLFYCRSSTPTIRVKQMLDLSDATALELQATHLASERLLWTELLRQMGQEPPTKVTALRKLAAMQLSAGCHAELLIIVRGIPRATEGLEQLLPVIVTLAEAVNVAWSEVENANPDLLGRVALVLESQEEIRTLTVEKADTRTSLYVEPLNG